MEWWVSGVFGLVGVLVGGIFTYLGLKEQLNQQTKLDSQQWKRKVISDQLLKLRTGLAIIASKADRLVASAQKVQMRIEITPEMTEANKNEYHSAVSNWNTYVTSKEFTQTLFSQYDMELVKKAEEIIKDYQDSYVTIVLWDMKDTGKFKEATEVFERNKVRIIEVQALINKKLEEL